MDKKIMPRPYDANNPIFLTSLSPVLQRIYAARGIREISQLNRQLALLLPSNQLKNIDEAAQLLAQHIHERSRILIIGDFDADGATSSALAVTALRRFGAADVHYLVPNRFAYGYGLTPEIVAVAAEYAPDLIITVDNGISSIAGVAAAKARGMQVLITDHHLPGEELPDADVIINPNQKGCEFTSKSLAGVGVIFYVMAALNRLLLNSGWYPEKNISPPKMVEFLDLVALGTVADVVPLDTNNRILVYHGLKRICAGLARPGIRALIKIAKRTEVRLQAQDLAFAVAPRLNAAGRIDDMTWGIECLLAEDEAKAFQYAEQLDQLNNERRAIEAEMQNQALQDISNLNYSQNLPPGVCLYDSTWHQGVIGIVAGRIKDKLHRPAIAFAKASETELKGSARSIEGIHIRDILVNIDTQNPNLLYKFGGHAMAAGLSLPPDNLTMFADLFSQELSKHVDPILFEPHLFTDGELPAEEITLDFIRLLEEAGPWGSQFPEPQFEGVFSLHQHYLVGEKHLKCIVTQPGSSRRFQAIAFNVDRHQWPNPRCERVHLVYRPQLQEYNNLITIQLVIEHMKIVNTT